MTTDTEGRGTDQENFLFERYQADKTVENRNAIIEQYMPVIEYHANMVAKRLPGSVDVNDLKSAGVFGMMKAIEAFDLSRGVKFYAYCAMRVRGSMLDWIRDYDWVPRRIRQYQTKYSKAVDSLMQEIGRNPDDSELADKLDMDYAELAKLRADCHVAAIESLDCPIVETDTGKVINRHQLIESLDDKPDTSESKRCLRALILRGLSQRDRLLLISYYFEGLTMKQTGKILGLDESRISQLLSKLLPQIRARLKDRIDEFF